MGDAGPGELGPTEYRSVPGLRVELAGSVLSLTLDRPERRNAIDDSMMRRLVDRRVEVAGRDESVRAIVLARRRRPLLRRGGHRRPQRRDEPGPGLGSHPAPPAVPGPPADPVAPHGAGARGLRGPGLGRRDRIPTGAGRRLHDRRRRRPPLGALHRPGIHAGQRRHLAAAAPGRRWCGRASSSCSVGSCPAGRRQEWGLVHRAVPAAEVATAVGELVDRLAAGPTVALGLTKWLLRLGRRARPRAAAAQRGLRPRDLLAERGLPRGPPGLRRAADAGLRWPVMTRLAVRSGMPADELRGDGAALDRRPRPTWLASGRRAGWGFRHPGRPLPGRLRGVVSGLRGLRSRGAHLASQEYGGLGLAPEEARVLEAELRRLQPRDGSTRWASTSPPRRSSPTAPRRNACATSRRSSATRRCGASSSASPVRARTWRRSPLGRSCGPATETWVVTGQKVWTTWAHLADFGVLLARTDPDAPKRRGLTYFLIDLHQPGVDVRPLRHITGEHRLQRGLPRPGRGARRPAGGSGAPGLGGRQRHPFRRASDGFRIRLGRSRPDRRLGSRSGGGQGGRAGRRRRDRQAGRHRRSGRPAGADGRAGRGADAGMDQPAGPGRVQGRAPAGSRELDRQGAPG